MSLATREAVEWDAMSEEPAAAADPGPKKSGKGLLFGLIGAVVLGGAAFAAVFLGFVPLGGDAPAPEEAVAEAPAEHPDEGAPDAHAKAAFVPIEPLVISLGPNSRSRHLKMTVQVEVAPEQQAQVAALTPRMVDVMNTFLRAVDERELELPRAMTRLRAQLLRRLQLVTPEGSVRDLLVQEFIFN